MKSREEVIGNMVEIITTAVKRFEGPKLACMQKSLAYEITTGTCDSTTYGSLTRSLFAAKLWPPPEAPYPGLSVKEISLMMNDLHIPSMCFEIESARAKHLGSLANIKTQPCHEIKKELIDKVVPLAASCTGLSYDDFCKDGK